jgi:CheY-like chemotaxis protein
MGGQIHVESEPGKGSKFTFTVQVGYAKTTGVEAVEEQMDIDDVVDEIADCALRGKRMLVAEDIEINREVLIALLEGSGIMIECAENGQEALEKIAADPEKYDIVLMDIQMPQMDGLEATRRIRALPPRQRKRLPIVAMTANVFRADIEECLAAGMDDHLGKPLDVEKVMDMLKLHLRA